MTDPPAPGGVTINLGDLSKPATVLIEKVADAIGGIAKPWQMKRIANAQADVNAIRARSKIEVSEIEQRAFERLIREEGKKQENIENITAKAIQHLTQDSKPEELDKDWLVHFFDRSRLVSNEVMQSLWARILGGEANNPGSFSNRTLNNVAAIDQRDADLFTQLCATLWTIEGTSRPIILGFSSAIHFFHNNVGLTFNRLTHLDDIGLISYNALGQGVIRRELPSKITVDYYGRSIVIELEQNTFMLVDKT